MKNFIQYANDLKQDLTETRRFLHENAELGDDLSVTTNYVMERLKSLGLEPEEISKAGITAVIKGGKPGKTILLRADMDALPMQEINELPYRSKTSYAHTCGHDLHTAMLLGAAKLLVDYRAELCGNVKLMFQPAEEIFTGAAAMLDQGLMRSPDVDASLDMHVMTELPNGTISCRSGFVTASCDGFKITVKGKGCHGAQPHNGIDPINVAAHILISLQELIARETPPSKLAVLTFGNLSAGATPNIIPETASMQGTMRCYDKDLRKHLFKRFREMVEYTAKAFGASAEIEELSDVPSIYANPEMMEQCINYIKELDDTLAYDYNYLVTASDDYARIAELVPSVFLAIGAAPEDPKLVYPNHNPNVIFNEDCLPIGAAVFAHCAFRWLSEHPIS